MEGRINRDSLTQNEQTAQNAEPRRYDAYTPKRSKRRYGGSYGAGGRRSYSQRELIPEGKDLLTVQALASGILLLFVMFVTLVQSPQTLEVKAKLKNAFSRHTTVEEAAEGLMSIKTAITKSDESEIPEALEVFKEVPVKEGNELNNDENAYVDPDVLLEINEQAGLSKN